VPGIAIAAAALGIGGVLLSVRRRRSDAPLPAPVTASEDARLDAALAAYSQWND
jgi:hypothetical protein